MAEKFVAVCANRSFPFPVDSVAGPYPSRRHWFDPRASSRKIHGTGASVFRSVAVLRRQYHSVNAQYSIVLLFL